MKHRITAAGAIALLTCGHARGASPAPPAGNSSASRAHAGLVFGVETLIIHTFGEDQPLVTWDGWVPQEGEAAPSAPGPYQSILATFGGQFAFGDEVDQTTDRLFRLLLTIGPAVMNTGKGVSCGVRAEHLWDVGGIAAIGPGVAVLGSWLEGVVPAGRSEPPPEPLHTCPGKDCVEAETDFALWNYRAFVATEIWFGERLALGVNFGLGVTESGRNLKPAAEDTPFAPHWAGGISLVIDP